MEKCTDSSNLGEAAEPSESLKQRFSEGLSKRKAPMDLTDNAINRIKYLLSIANKEYIGVRVGVKSGGCSGHTYFIEYAEKIEKFDEILECDNFKVLIDPKAIIYLLGTRMDYVEGEIKSGFTFINPNEAGRCGCGESFYT